VIRRLEPADRDAAAATLATAFENDAMLKILEPQPHRRPRVARFFFGCIVDFALRWAQVWVDEEASAVAIWVPPGSGGMTTVRMLRVGIARLPLYVGVTGTVRLLRANAELDRMHHAAVTGPHWYIPAIGVRPELAGRGKGALLLAVGTRSADEAGVPCYGEATSEYSAAFAARRGFVVTEERVIGGFMFRSILRPPQSPGSG
jgi:hypothetical protein